MGKRNLLWKMFTYFLVLDIAINEKGMVLKQRDNLGGISKLNSNFLTFPKLQKSDAWCDSYFAVDSVHQFPQTTRDRN